MISKGDYIYIVDEFNKRLRKVLYVGKKYYEFNCGWGEVAKLKPNQNKKSNVKWIKMEVNKWS